MYARLFVPRKRHSLEKSDLSMRYFQGSSLPIIAALKWQEKLPASHTFYRSSTPQKKSKAMESFGLALLLPIVPIVLFYAFLKRPFSLLRQQQMERRLFIAGQ